MLTFCFFGIYLKYSGSYKKGDSRAGLPPRPPGRLPYMLKYLNPSCSTVEKARTRNIRAAYQIIMTISAAPFGKNILRIWYMPLNPE